ncbi:MAG: hypothetical protein RL223_1406 [Pseudomonadota bacterium]|jgi:hypothetical protein
MSPTALLSAAAAGLALGGLSHAAWWRLCHRGPGWPADGREHLAGASLRGAVALAAWALLGDALAPGAAAVAGMLLTGAWAVFETINLTALKYLNLPALRVRRDLPLQTSSSGGLASMLATARNYVPLPLLGGLWLGAALLLLAAVPGRAQAAVAAGAALALSAGAALARTRDRSRRPVPRPAEAAFLTRDTAVPPCAITRVPQPQAVRPSPGRPAQARHVLLIINESAGDDVPAGLGEGVSLADRLCSLGGRADEWVRPVNAVTPSACTEITLPCLLTGTAPQDGYPRFAQTPSIFDLARARGMRTVFYSAGSLQWAQLETLLDFHAQDDMLSPQQAGLPFINDLGCDDHLIAQRLHDHILATEGPLCIVVYFHGLHLPFQKDSACPIPEAITDRRRRAAHITEAAHALVFEALRRSGRFDDTLIVSVGDHGEAFGVDPAEGSSRHSRLTRLSATVTRPLFLIKPPRGLDDDARARLRANAGQLVSLIDVAPTVASVLGVELAPGLRWSGLDLCRQPVPDDRVHYTLNVNEWRAWPQAAVMIAQGDLRICIDHQSPDTLCSDGRGQPLPEARWPQTDDLLAQALQVPRVQQAITRVFRDKLETKRPPRSRVPPGQAMAMAMATAAVPARLRAAPGQFEAFFGPDVRPTDPPDGRLHCPDDGPHGRGIRIRAAQGGIRIHGPYVDLDPGRYRASFLFARGANGRPLDLDVVSQQNACIQTLRLPRLSAGRVASVDFELEQAASAVEVRLHNRAGFAGRCLGLHLAALETAVPTSERTAS